MTKEVLIFPYSGTALEALDCLDEQWKCIGFISDDETLVGQVYFGIKVYSREALHEFPHAKVLAVHGSPSSFRNRKQIIESLQVADDRFACIIHKHAAVSTRACIGRNVLMMAGVVVSANAVINDHVIILPNSVIHHDSIIGPCTLIGANVTVAGNVTIGSNCYLGAASSFKNGISIGDNVLVGMGANVVSACKDGVVLVGNPAKPFIKTA